MTQRKKPARAKAKRLAPGEKFFPLCTLATTLALVKGEKYAGLLLDDSGAPKEHLILLEGELESATWKNATAWAKKQGGALPTQQEQSLLFANLKKQFQHGYYWSCAPLAGNNFSAWCQGFPSGVLNYGFKASEFRARAVRRVSI